MSENIAPKPFVISQLEEALEERQNNDRRKINQPLKEGETERRQHDRRSSAAEAAKNNIH